VREEKMKQIFFEKKLAREKAIAIFAIDESTQRKHNGHGDFRRAKAYPFLLRGKSGTLPERKGLHDRKAIE
jgi:hypothetical protein